MHVTRRCRRVGVDSTFSRAIETTGLEYVVEYSEDGHWHPRALGDSCPVLSLEALDPFRPRRPSAVRDWRRAHSP